MNRRLGALSATFSVMLAAAPAQGADLDKAILLDPQALPAVSGPNWKAAIAAGLYDFEDISTDGRFHGEFSYTAPLDFATGFQLDGSIGVLEDEFTGSIGGHLFTRDPSSHLLGIFGAYSAVGSNDIVRIGPEAELYLDNITIQLAAGFEDSDSNNSDVFAYGNLALYPDPNLQLYIGYRRTLDRDAGAIGFEWLTGHRDLFSAPMSVFAEAQAGSDNHATIWAGIRFYFSGQDKSLIRRHREDDPVNIAPALNQIVGCVPFLLPDSVFDSCGSKISKGD